ncbi:hybrid sensor histidine kinase/response regulator [Malaciobacter canalis]|jgi:C4-dicarboxylate-specific signal transduction histidine kinase|uniref:histidine kinase n=2 Tax=Malaciobacter TaxID=2321114 RepID=A0AB36ZX42_9BACT|nr:MULTISPECIES: hybrid sensor histidine kinase/response regulator [Malaciobacter]PHO08751.1 hybrid sensor histidine kinase/response regulator [Malaciobacter canalis]PPK61558.1 histidine kinase/DNA gyrase B/HSP90-like ATPase [Malaciobacter marinus]QEE32795.1 two-component system sensor histidine kinase/response regulator fusion protein [Malaciobacter canalis]SKB58020.1 Histidine kinase-, DNA gyrase B-, and HSP90-like ATPase [Malaciobacter marinus]
MKDIKILAVDDIEANRVSLQYLIQEYLENVELVLASSGEEALKITYKEEIDIIILDVQMPGLDGFDTAKYLKSNPRTQNIPIIFLTAAFKKEEFQQKGFQIGAIDYLTKPIENHQFINKLNLYIEVIIKNKQLEAVNDNLYKALQKEIELKEQVQKQQLELIEQSKMAALGEMIGNIAHQWRQPLSLITTCASGVKLNLQLGIDDKNEILSSMQKIMNTSQDLSETIDNFRDLSCKEKLSKFNLTEIINKSIKAKEHLISENNINIITNLDDTIELTNLPNSLVQALVNLIHNSKDALEKSDLEKYIFIDSYTNKDNLIEIIVTDNAGGIKTEHINKVFEPYFTTKHQAHGIGLGLNITYKVINDSMYGKIKINNTKFTYQDNEYEGAQVKITLPFKI